MGQKGCNNIRTGNFEPCRLITVDFVLIYMFGIDEKPVQI